MARAAECRAIRRDRQRAVVRDPVRELDVGPRVPHHEDELGMVDHLIDAESERDRDHGGGRPPRRACCPGGARRPRALPPAGDPAQAEHHQHHRQRHRHDQHERRGEVAQEQQRQPGQQPGHGQQGRQDGQPPQQPPGAVRIGRPATTVHDRRGTGPEADPHPAASVALAVPGPEPRWCAIRPGQPDRSRPTRNRVTNASSPASTQALPTISCQPCQPFSGQGPP